MPPILQPPKQQAAATDPTPATERCPGSAHNEWDPAEELIVGDPTNARWPAGDLGFDRAARDETFPPGPLPERIVEETREDIEAFVELLTGLGIRVRRAAPRAPHTVAMAGW